MERRMRRRFGLASSLISSSERIQRRISVESSVRGSSVSKRSSRLSGVWSAFSRRPYALTRAVFSRSAAVCRSSVMFMELPISRRFNAPRISLASPKEMWPFLKSRVSASCVSCCIRVIWEREEEGTSSRHFFRPSGELAYEASCSIILSYSSVFNAF